jgi:hypothetical protein
MASLEQHRCFFAKLLVHGAGSTDERWIAAFSDIAREDFLGPGPWCAMTSPTTEPGVSPRAAGCRAVHRTKHPGAGAHPGRALADQGAP